MANLPDDPFEKFQRFMSRAKVILVEIASFIGLGLILYQGLRLEMKW